MRSIAVCCRGAKSLGARAHSQWARLRPWPQLPSERSVDTVLAGLRLALRSFGFAGVDRVVTGVGGPEPLTGSVLPDRTQGAPSARTEATRMNHRPNREGRYLSTRPVSQRSRTLGSRAFRISKHSGERRLGPVDRPYPTAESGPRPPGRPRRSGTSGSSATCSRVSERGVPTRARSSMMWTHKPTPRAASASESAITSLNGGRSHGLSYRVEH